MSMPAQINVSSRSDWATALLSALQAPITQNNVNTLVAWETAEGGAGPQFGVPNNIANYNPLNVTETYGQQGYGYDPGTGKFYAGASPTPGNDPPVASFSDWNTGLQATADRLQEPFASGILNALRSNASESAVSSAVASSGWGTGNFSGSGTNAPVTGGGSASAPNTSSASATLAAQQGSPSAILTSAQGGSVAGGGQAGAPYTPSIIPGVAATPPPFPDVTLNPVNEIGRIITWSVEFGGWAIFTLLVLLFGLVFLGVGMLMLIVLLLQPVASPIAEVVGGGVIGRATKRTTTSARQTPSAPAVDETAGAQHVARGAHSPGASGRTRSTEAVRRHKTMMAAEEREERGQAKANRSVHAAHGRAERSATRSRTRDRQPRDRSQLTRPRAG